MSEEAVPEQVPSPWDPSPGDSKPEPPQQPLSPPGAFPPPPGTQYGSIQYSPIQYGSAQYHNAQYGQQFPAYPVGPNPGVYGPGPYGYGAPMFAPQQTTSGMAIASLVLGICGFACVTPFVGLGLGIAALVQISKTGRPGKGLAIAGIILSSAWILLMALALATGSYSTGGSSTDGGSSGGDTGVMPWNGSAHSRSI